MTKSRSDESKLERKASDYIYTRSGLKIYPEEMTEDQVRLEDIAYGLSQIKRFNGQSPISVLRHSVGVANHFSPDKRPDLYRWALLHDASEAYMMDVPVPLKRFMSKQWALIYSHVEGLIISKYDVSPDAEVHEEVREVDQAVVEYEMDYALMRCDSRMSYPCEKKLSLADIDKLNDMYLWGLSESGLMDYFVGYFKQHP